MKKTGLNQLREMFLSYFEAKGHKRLPSFSLVPEADKSLLLVNAGMAPMKKYFTGEAKPPSLRVTTCQKCIRTPDIEIVGKTSRHATYFEMLGNFSFGDYFKREAIEWAWDFSVNTVGLSPDEIYISVYEEDDETYDIWKNKIGIAKEKIVRLGKEDNFWELGPGPCGPCTEMYHDKGVEYGCGSEDCMPGCECDRFVEYWNLVFTQFESDGKGNYTELKKKNIDTGMGLERLACIIQGVGNIFEVDTVQNIMQKISDLTGKKYGQDEEVDTSLRVITDHIRSTSFLIADGVLPSNEGRGYVLRRLIRRAARHGRLLGVTKPFLFQVCDCVIDENLSAYPYLEEKRDLVKRVMKNEEENFERTIDKGLELLGQIMDASKDKSISGEEAFKLADTFGFPLELTIEIAEEEGFYVDQKTFSELMAQQRQRAREARKNAGEDGWEKSYDELTTFPPTKKTAYSVLETETVIKAVFEDEDDAMSLQLVPEESPFYVESGGQLGDEGRIFNDSFDFHVEFVASSPNDVLIHGGRLLQGSLPKVGDKVKIVVDKDLREATAKNHTSAHLLHAALREVLGDHVSQAGQEVGADLMRLDFTHFAALNEEEISAVEDLVNNTIMEALPVSEEFMSLEAAKASGAVALFDEKYGEDVRVIRTGGFSAELCGGTHVENTGNIGLFKITSESSVAAGVRRIEAVTGFNAIGHLRMTENKIKNIAQLVKGNVNDPEKRIQSILAKLKEEENKNSALSSKLLKYDAEQLIKNAKDYRGLKLVTAKKQMANPKDIRQLCDDIKATDELMLVVLAGVSEDKSSLSFCAAAGKGAVSLGVHCGNLVREVAKLAGGSGGGRPDSAMAGAKDISKVDKALKAVESLINSQLEK
ncbi:MAG: alanine--tRNA ligase [Clostridiales bacterium]|nr:alanine--tRNA ligase [Clostridiales bacterium]